MTVRTVAAGAVPAGAVAACGCAAVPAADAAAGASGIHALTGELGGALETILRAFQVTRAVLPSAAVGLVDQQLRTVTDFAVGRRLYRRSVADLPHARKVPADAFLDLLIGDAFATTVCRALHLLPGQTSCYAAAVKYLVPELFREAVDSLGVVLGARSFLREGRHAIFQKHARDLPVASLVHAGGTVCQATVIPQLPRLARNGWLRDEPAPAELFHLAGPLPELDFDRLATTAGRTDPLLAVLPAAAERFRDEPELGPLCRRLLDEVTALKGLVDALPPRDRTPLAGPVSFELAHRYALLLAAAACLGVWQANPDNPSAFLRGPEWLVAALGRLTARLGCPPVAGAREAEESVVTELVRRYEECIAFDLIGRRLA
ncbi:MULTISPECIES: acyl-CoA dehydrogenase family protein [Kitasatospora]|uniref:Acyl-CoA dehydrogenase/oxidase C-terminal domain-containing protein n=1 Tax=Kitasatospora setae (strain ATCC 33774 / DSM 43861 / JCM 3304 / KCC A-0304 / NBRC 14216 / KM-6054) TaxID=452652 RepID=E4N3T9_KITSK|nr:MULTISPECIES: acyl-CoA dehydrogenase family protein [Kitasatospora]BAJ31570.1 hypothetical protein KSE_57990 [Kitasatospora setae KM-6054]